MSQRSSFERLTLPHLDAAFNLAFWLVRSAPDAEDIVQESYMRAFRAFQGFTGTDAKPWLLAIVRNAAYRWLSNRRRAENVISLDEAFGSRGEEPAEAQVASEDPTPEAQLIGEVDRGLVQRGLAELPPVFREIVVLREIEGLAYREISRVTGAPLGTVMSRLARGRKELRKTMRGLMDKDKPNAL
jgi:RNA polymerase sigma-70 factor (ECF subfamily)